MKVSYEENFCRVFELPTEYPRGFLFGGGKPVNFLMVDWFNPLPPGPGLRYDQDYNWEEVEKKLREFLREKLYVLPGKKYLVITDFGKSFVFTMEG